MEKEKEEGMFDSGRVIGSVMEIAGAESIPELGEGPRVIKSYISYMPTTYPTDMDIE